MSNEELLEIAHGFGYDGEGLDALYQWSFENKIQVTKEMLEAYEEGYFHW